MAQTPMYSNSPIRDINRISNLLAELVAFGIVHEDIYSNIDTVMLELYRHKCRKEEIHEKNSGVEHENEFDDHDDDDDDPEENFWNPTSSALFYEIPEKDRPQYIQDLRNTISHCMFSGTWSTDSVAEQILSMRDIDYYNNGVELVEDTEILEKFSSSARSIWYPSEVIPVRHGIYEICFDHSEPKHSGFAYWDGNTWFERCILLDDCIGQQKSSETKISWKYCWRGFLEPQERV